MNESRNYVRARVSGACPPESTPVRACDRTRRRRQRRDQGDRREQSLRTNMADVKPRDKRTKPLSDFGASSRADGPLLQRCARRDRGYPLPRLAAEFPVLHSARERVCLMFLGHFSNWSVTSICSWSVALVVYLEIVTSNHAPKTSVTHGAMTTTQP